MYEFSSKPTNFTHIFSSQNLPTLRVPPVSNTYQFYIYLLSPTPINFTHIFRLQHPEPMPRLPLVRQPYAGALSKDEIQHLRRLSRGSADPREHSRS